MDPTLAIGLSALLTAQKNLDVTGHNIANQATPNYSRQRVSLAPVPPSRLAPGQSGAGVAIVGIQAIRDTLIDRLLLANDPSAGAAERRGRVLSEIESLFSTDPETGLGQAIAGLFNSFRDLASRPAGSAERAAVVHNAQALASAFNSTGDALAGFQRGLAPQIEDAVAQINRLTGDIAALNGRVRDTVIQHGDPNDLVDQRFTLLRQLATLIPLEVTENTLGRVDVRVGGQLLVASDRATELSARSQGAEIEVYVGDSAAVCHPASGELGALLGLANDVLPDYRTRLDALAAALAREVNRVHATGVGRDGSFSTLHGTRAVSNPALPLNQCGLPFPLEAGTLTVSVIHQATGEVTQAHIAFDPETDSLADLAASLDAVAGIRAFVGGGTLEIAADSGYAFDFTNKVPTHPGNLGTSAVTLRGAVALDADDTYTFTASGSGTIGSTPDLSVAVRNAAGQTVATLAVGQGYTPGQALELPGGVTAAFGAGTLAGAPPDALSVALAADPDERGLLAALGLNTLLRGSSARGLSVEPAIEADPSLIAAARSDAAADNANALRLADIQERVFDGLGGTTLDDAYAQLLGKAGLDSQMAQRACESTRLMLEAAENQRDAISGVSQDEEAVNLIRFQQAYMFAARYLRTIEEVTNLLAQM